MFSSAVQVIALATLLNCPSEFSEKCLRTAETDAFKADPSLVSMKEYLMRGIFKNRRPVRQSGSVWDDEDDTEEPTHSNRHSRARQPAPSSRRWEGRADESDDDNEERPLAHAVRSRSQPRKTSTPVRDPQTRRRELLFPTKPTQDASVFASDSDDDSSGKKTPPPKTKKHKKRKRDEEEVDSTVSPIVVTDDGGSSKKTKKRAKRDTSMTSSTSTETSTDQSSQPPQDANELVMDTLSKQKNEKKEEDKIGR